MREFCISLKPDFKVYAVSVSFMGQVYMMPGGYTSYDIVFAVARDENEAEDRVLRKLADKGLNVRKVDASLACQQDIRRYCFSDSFPGFAEGCVHPEYAESPHTEDQARRLVNDAFQFLTKGTRMYEDIRELASKLGVMWSSFGYWSHSSCELQDSAISVLESIRDGSLSGALAEESLYGVTGIFNQSLSSVVNFSGSPRF